MCRRYFLPLLFLASLFTFFGCGDEGNGVSERLSGTGEDTALPIRVDATVTPSPTATPHTEQTPQAGEDLAAIENDQDDATPTPDEPEITATPTILEDENTQQEETLIEDPLPTPTPAPSPSKKESVEISPPKSHSEKPAPPQDISKATATPTPEPRKTPTAAEKTQPKKNDRKETRPKIEKQTSTPTPSKPKIVKEPPIVTPYGVTLNKLVVCATISNRNPSRIANEFSISKVKKVYTWMKVSGVTPPRTLKHIYYWEGKFVAEVKLKMKYSSMRTWSQKALKPLQSLGKWKVMITTENEDEVLALKEFTVVP